MRIAVFHNRYLQRGGEDTAVDVEVELLAKAGHEVTRLDRDNREEVQGRILGPLRTAFTARWNPESAKRVAALLARERVDVAHVHNAFPLWSPSLHHALAAAGVPVVQTLHNYRLICANGYLLRNGRSCDDCVGRGPWNAVRHGCYRNSRFQTAVWSEMTAYHRRRGTWEACVDRFLVPSGVARSELLRGGLPEDRTEVVPYALRDPGEPAPPGRGGVYVGRLSQEKGVDLLIDAWRGVDAPLTIVGGGPEEVALRRRAAQLPQVRFLGAQAEAAVTEALRQAAFAIVPSRWREISPFAAIEALANGRAVVAWSGGALRDLIDDGSSGCLFDGLEPESLRSACLGLLRDPALAARLGAEARERYLDRHAPDVAVERLERVYRAVIGASRRRRPDATPPPDARP